MNARITRNPAAITQQDMQTQIIGHSKPFGLRKNPGAGSPEELQHQPRPRKVEGPRLPVPPVGAVIPSPGAAFAGRGLGALPPAPRPLPLRVSPCPSVSAASRRAPPLQQILPTKFEFCCTSHARSTKQKLLLTAADRGGSPVLLWLLCAVRRVENLPNARSALSAGLPFGCPVAPWLKQGRKRKRLLPFGNSLFIFHQKGSSSLLLASSNGSKPSNCSP